MVYICIKKRQLSNMLCLTPNSVFHAKKFDYKYNYKRNNPQ